MTFKAIQGVHSKKTIECAFKTDLAVFYMYPVAIPSKKYKHYGSKKRKAICRD